MASSRGQQFAGFNLQNAASLRSLATSVEHWRRDGRDLASAELRGFTRVQQATVVTTVLRINRSPLYRDILLSGLVGVIRDGGADKIVLEAGTYLQSYLIPGSDQPNSEAFPSAEIAWRAREPPGRRVGDSTWRLVHQAVEDSHQRLGFGAERPEWC
jgi:hypothetical protein